MSEWAGQLTHPSSAAPPTTTSKKNERGVLIQDWSPQNRQKQRICSARSQPHQRCFFQAPTAAPALRRSPPHTNPIPARHPSAAQRTCSARSSRASRWSDRSQRGRSLADSIACGRSTGSLRSPLSRPAWWVGWVGGWAVVGRHTENLGHRVERGCLGGSSRAAAGQVSSSPTLPSAASHATLRALYALPKPPSSGGSASTPKRRWQRPPRTIEQALWAEVAAVLVVAALVEQAADLVHPALAAVALHPPLLHLQMGREYVLGCKHISPSVSPSHMHVRWPPPTQRTYMRNSPSPFVPAPLHPRPAHYTPTLHPTTTTTLHTHSPPSSQTHTLHPPRRRSCASPAPPCAPQSRPAPRGRP